MNWFDQSTWSSFWTDAQKNMMQPWTTGHTAPSGGAMPSSGVNSPPDGMQQMNELIARSMEGWTKLMQSSMTAQSGQPVFDMAAVSKLFDPGIWSKTMSSVTDFALERLAEGPTFATLSDIDRKVANAQKLWLQRAAAIEGYRLVVQAAWGRALEKFSRDLNDASGAPLKSSREVLDLWLKIANDALLEMHHRPEFIEAQVRTTRAAALYRLQEQELAEAFCTANHIPTRTEMDEVQHTMHEMRRELRALKRQAEQRRKA